MGSRSLHRHPTTTDVTSDAPPQTAAWRSQDVGAPVTQLSDHYGAWERGRPGKGSGGGRFEGLDGGGGPVLQAGGTPVPDEEVMSSCCYVNDS